VKEIDSVPGKHAVIKLFLMALILNPGISHGQQGFSLNSPHRSESRTRRFLDDIVLDALLTYDYTESDAASTDWKIESIAGLRGKRYLIKHPGYGGSLALEVAYSPAPAGGYQIYAYGRRFDLQGNVSANPDLPTFKARIEYSITQAKTAQSAGPQDVGYEIYSLSYLQSDRTLAILKALGYTTVEYTMAAGETPNDRVYGTFMTGQWKLPVVIKLIDSTKSSLMDPAPQGSYQQQKQATDLGGTYLHQQTSGEPQQRLLIAYDRNNPDPMQDLLNLLRQKLDLPSRQIVIEALVIEINTDKMRDLGINLRTIDSNYDASFEKDPSSGTDLPFTFTFNRKAFSDVLFFRAGLTALMQSGNAEILSSPSVLVLDGRQARIQVGQQVPVSKSVSTTSGFSSGVEYIQTGIVLNLRPRISEDGGEITMQVETIVSAVNEDLSIQTVGEGGTVLLAPRVDNRQVQTFVRVADNTPFIIGGLISTEKKERTVGIPILSQIPILGIPFRRKATESVKKEVIVVLTPHVVPVGEKSFSYVMPKDSDMFDGFGNTLFRNGYRIRDDDIFDLKFLYQSEIFQSLISEIQERAEGEPGFGNTPPFDGLLSGGVPGEEILVRRMLWEIVLKSGFAENIDIDRIITFEEYPAAPDSSGFRTRFLNQLLEAKATEGNTLALTFSASTRGTANHPFVPPKAKVGYQSLEDGDSYIRNLMVGNRPLPDGSPNAWTVLLSDVNPSGVRGATGIEVLQGVLVLKRILALNKSLPLSIREFRVGRQIIFPTEQDLQQRFHIIDRDAARFFYEVIQYYPEFEQSFNRQTRRITQVLRHGR